MSYPRCRLCSTELRHTFVDLGHVAAVRELPDRRPARQRRDVLPAARADLRELPAGPAARLHPRRGHLLRLRLLLLLLRLLGGARPAVRRGRGRATLALGPGLVRGRGGQQRRLPAAAQRRPRHPVARHRAGRQHRRGRPGQGHRRPRWCSSARRPARTSPPGTARPTWSWPTTSSPTCPTSSTSAKGLRALVADDGTVTIEIPHLLRLIEGNEYDTIYHEHYSYLSLLTAQRVLAAAGLTVVDVEELPTHGGSLRTVVDAGRAARRRGAAVGGQGARRRGGRRAATPSRATPGFAAVGGERSQRPRRVPARLLSARASGWPATARPARATRCSTTAASAPT